MREKFTEQFHRLLCPQRGAIMVFFVILVPVLFGFMGLAIDFGLAYVQKGKLQDIADATALAAAAHLHDGEGRMDAIKESVDKYAQANGLKGFDLLYKESESAWDAQEQPSAIGRYSVAYGIVTVTKDGVERERVRVRIAERVPTFFLRALGEEFKSGMLVAAKAAAEGGTVSSEETPEEKDEETVYAPGPGLMGASTLMFYSTNLYSAVDPTKNVLETDLYLPNNSYTTINGTLSIDGIYTAYYDLYNINVVDGDGNGLIPLWWEEWGTEAQKEAIQNITNAVAETKSSCENFVAGINVEDYKAGKDNKVYINKDGIWPQGIVIDSSKTYDVYMDASYMVYDGDGIVPNSSSVVTNKYLHGITKINDFVLDAPGQGVFLNTNSITYKNVYELTGCLIDGENNKFNGVIYNSNMVCIGGVNNTYTQVYSNTIKIGYGFNYEIGSEGEIPNFKAYFNPVDRSYRGGSNSTGSTANGGNSNSNDSNSTSGNGSTTTIGGKTHLRLVE